MLPWKRAKLWKDDHQQTMIMGLKGWNSPQVDLIATYSETMSRELVKDYARLSDSWMSAPNFRARDFFVLLATLNDLPVSFNRIAPTKGYFKRGYRHFASHTVVHLTVPETRWYQTIRRTAAAIRRRAHQVRGHWRVDWRKPILNSCTHDWNQDMCCNICRGHYIWIAEHERGDRAAGIVTHDYAVHTERSARAQ
jgi:hypothetical protein